jgi:hypothetical protein
MMPEAREKLILVQNRMMPEAREKLILVQNRMMPEARENFGWVPPSADDGVQRKINVGYPAERCLRKKKWLEENFAAEPEIFLGSRRWSRVEEKKISEEKKIVGIFFNKKIFSTRVDKKKK